jgi:hypothetical protein
MRYAIANLGLLATFSTPLVVGWLTTMPAIVIAQDGEQEKNDTPADAQRVSTSARIRNSLSSAKDVDFFRIDIRKNSENPEYDPSGNLTVDFSQKAPPGGDPKSGWRFDLYLENDLANSLYTVIWPETTVSTAFEIGLGVGRYYYKVSSLDTEVFSDKEYTIKNSWEESPYFEKSPNEAPKTATPVILNNGYSGNLSTIEDVDFYRFSLDNADTVTITLSQANPNNDSNSGWTFNLLDQPDRVIKMPSTALQSEPLQASLQPGIYYVRVGSFVPNENIGSDLTTGDKSESATSASSNKAVIGQRYQLLIKAASAPSTPVECNSGVVYGQHPITLKWVSFPTTCEVPKGWLSTPTTPEGFQECPVCPICPPIPHASYTYKTTQDGLLEIPVVDLKLEDGTVQGFYSAQLQQLPNADPARFSLTGATAIVIEPEEPVTTPVVPSTEEVPETTGVSETTTP